MPTIFRDPVTINDFSFNTGVKTDGAVFSCDVMDGWGDSGEPKVEVSSFGYSDGVVPSSRFPLSEKYIEFGGYVVTDDRLSNEKAADKLSVLFDQNTDLVVTRFGPIAKAMDMRASGDFQIEQDMASAGFRFMIRLMAPWPFKFSPMEKTGIAGVFSGSDFSRLYTDAAPYGRVYDSITFGRNYVADTVNVTTSTVSDNVTIINEGTATAYPVITVVGPLVGNEWELINETTLEAQSFELDLSTGATLTIDSKEKTAYISGQAVDYYLRGDWIRLVPGINVIRLASGDANPDARFTVSTHDTWKR